VERWLSPICRRIGFRSDLGLEDLLIGSPLHVLERRRVGPFGYWKIVTTRNEKSLREHADTFERPRQAPRAAVTGAAALT
jgi:hypothetical protein